MGGHGALISHLKNPGVYTSVSAFAPICKLNCLIENWIAYSISFDLGNPTQCPWGDKAFNGYLGSVEAGKAYDATELMKNYQGPKAPILIDQGTGMNFWCCRKYRLAYFVLKNRYILADGFLKGQLLPENLAAAAAKANYPISLNMRPLYDHSYYFM